MGIVKEIKIEMYIPTKKQRNYNRNFLEKYSWLLSTYV